jgi:hypothetical protein
MANMDLIKSKLPENLREKAESFTIPDEFLTTMPELIILVLNSKSMDNSEEKQSWFNLMPMMSPEQIEKLKDILTREKEKLNEIEKKYENKKDELKNKYTQKWDNMVNLKRVEEIKKQEALSEQNEKHDEEALLNQL